MSETTARTHLVRILENLEDALPRIDAARRNLANAQPGIASATTDGGSRSTDDPSWRMANRVATTQRDPAVQDGRRLPALLALILVDLETLAWPTGHTATGTVLERVTTAAQRVQERFDGLAMDRTSWKAAADLLGGRRKRHSPLGGESLLRKTEMLRSLVTTWAPAVKVVKTAEDIWCQHCARHGAKHPHENRARVGGLVVCKWAARFHGRHGRLPNRAEVDRHEQGKPDVERITTTARTAS